MATKWTEENPDWIVQYDEAFNRVREVLGSYNRIAGELYRFTGEHITGQGVRRWVLEGGVPIKWACAFVDLMAEKGETLSVFDFYPWLAHYVDRDDDYLK